MAAAASPDDASAKGKAVLKNPAAPSKGLDMSDAMAGKDDEYGDDFFPAAGPETKYRNDLHNKLVRGNYSADVDSSNTADTSVVTAADKKKGIKRKALKSKDEAPTIKKARGSGKAAGTSEGVTEPEPTLRNPRARHLASNAKPQNKFQAKGQLDISSSGAIKDEIQACEELSAFLLSLGGFGDPGHLSSYLQSLNQYIGWLRALQKVIKEAPTELEMKPKSASAPNGESTAKIGHHIAPATEKVMEDLNSRLANMSHEDLRKANTTTTRTMKAVNKDIKEAQGQRDGEAEVAKLELELGFLRLQQSMFKDAISKKPVATETDT